MDPCPVDCEGSWSSWTECSQQCTDCQSYGSIGSKSRKFTITVQAAHGGKQCPQPHDTVEEKVCNDKCCPVDCVGYGPNSLSALPRVEMELRSAPITSPNLHFMVVQNAHAVISQATLWPAMKVHALSIALAVVIVSHCSKECDGGEK